MKKLLPYIFAALLFNSAASLAQAGFPELTTSDVQGMEVLRKDYFDGGSLWGYIDGGADVYLEYGFKKLLVQEVDINNINLKIDIYEMNDSESAFGIFSIFSFKCNNNDELPCANCVTRYQVQAVSGRYYISIVNQRGDKESGRLALSLAQELVKKTGEEQFQYPSLFAREELFKYQKNIKFVKGRLGVQNGVPEWEDLFSEIKSFSFYVASVKAGKESISAAQIKFGSEDDLGKFYSAIGLKTASDNSYHQTIKEGVVRGLWKQNPNEVIFIEAKAGTSGFNRIQKALDNYVKE